MTKIIYFVFIFFYQFDVQIQRLVYCHYIQIIEYLIQMLLQFMQYIFNTIGFLEQRELQLTSASQNYFVYLFINSPLKMNPSIYHRPNFALKSRSAVTKNRFVCGYFKLAFLIKKYSFFLEFFFLFLFFFFFF